MLVWRVLRAAGIAQGHPNEGNAEHVLEYIVADRAPGIWDDGGSLTGHALQRGFHPGRPRVVWICACSIKAARIFHRRFVNFNHRITLSVQMSAKRGKYVLGIGADHVAELAVRMGPRWHGVDGLVRVPCDEGEDLEGIPSVDFFGFREARFPPPRVDFGSVWATLAFNILEGLANGVTNWRRRASGV